VTSNDPDTPELDLAEKLASFDEALKDGRASDETFHPALHAVQDCLRLLEDLWPRNLNNAITPLKHALAAAGAPPSAVGGFQIVRELGRGGFGIVYLAHDPQLKREVALKVPRSDMQISPELRQRFQREARAAAGLEHPNLVPVYESGEEGSHCYIVSAYCPGINLAEWLHLQTEPAPIADAARLVATLADAVQHAHGRGVLHRDLKPANILLSASGGAEATPASRLPALTPKITDFGLAKLVDADLQTQTGATIGTPSYMAPEQAVKSSTAIGPAADVYALGVILYELLTGRLPFIADSPLETLLIVQNEEPVPPSRLRHPLPRDLETICLKCLRKEPGKRYATAAALAEDLRRFLDGLPIAARPLTLGERAWRWARRRPAVASLAALLVLTLVGGFVGVLWALFLSVKARDDAVAAQLKESEALDRHRIMRAYDEWASDNAQAARDLLRDTEERKDTWEWRYVDRLCNLGSHVFADHQATVIGMAFLGDGRLVTADRRGVIFIRDLVAGSNERIVLSPERPEELVNLSLSPANGRHLAFGTASGSVLVWDVEERKMVDSWKATDQRMSVRAVYSPDGRSLALSIGNTARIWDMEQRRDVKRIPIGGEVLRLCWSPDGRFLAGCANRNPRVQIFNAKTGKREASLPTIFGISTRMEFSPDNRRFAWAGMDGIVAIHETTSPQFERVATLSGQPGYQACLAYSPDGRRVAAGSVNGPVRIWNVETSQLMATLHGHSGGVQELVFSPDGSRLATVGDDRRVIVSDATDQQELAVFYPAAIGRFAAAAFSPDQRLLVTGIRRFQLWNLDEHTEIFPSAGAPPAVSVAFHPGGQQFAGGDETGVVQVFDTTKKLLAREKMVGWPLAMIYSSDGREVLVAGWGNSVMAWDPAGKEPPRILLGPLGKPDRASVRLSHCQAAFSPDRRWLAYAERGAPLTIWDLQARARKLTIDDAPSIVSLLAFDLDGQTLAVGSDTGSIEIRSVVNGQSMMKFPGHPSRIRGLAFTSVGKRLASIGMDGNIKLWDTQTGHEVLSLRGQAAFDTTLTFSPDGERLVSGGWDGYIRMWSVGDPKKESVEMQAARQRAWHLRQANESNSARQWHAAHHHWDWLVKLETNNWEFHRERGWAGAELGKWNLAASDFDAAMANAECTLTVYRSRAVLFLRDGDTEGFRRLCQRAAEAFAQDDSWFAFHTVAWTCTLSPAPPIPADRLVKLAEQALDKATGQNRETARSTLGAALFRAGRDEEAIRQLNASIKARKGGFVEDWLFLAAAHHRAGHKEKADEFWSRATEDMAKARADALLEDGRTFDWRLRFELDLLFQEMRKTLAKTASNQTPR
jgi:eukaryotic-like serine/threonine-protein kinase